MHNVLFVHFFFLPTEQDLPKNLLVPARSIGRKIHFFNFCVFQTLNLGYSPRF